MRTKPKSFISRLFVTTVLLFSMMAGVSVASAQTAETSHTYEEFGVTIGWTDQWEVALPTTEAPILSLGRDSSISVLIHVMDGQEVTPEDAVWFMYQEGDEIIEDRTSENPPHLVVSVEETGINYVSEAYSLNGGEVTVLVSVGTIPVLQSSAIGIMQDDITINGAPVMTGEPLDDSSSATTEATSEATGRTSRVGRDRTATSEETPEATEESGGVSRTSRGSEEPTVEPTEPATAEATEEITRTSRTGSGDTETPEATVEPTEVPTEEPTVEPTEEVIVTDEPGTYTGPVWGHTITYDTDLWEEADSFENPVVDSVRLDGGTTTVFFTGTSEYGADPVACLEGEVDYFGGDRDNISDWELTSDSSGDPLMYESDELAWGVYSYTFHSSSGTDVEFVDYLSCETIPGEDAVLIVQMTSFPDEYNDNLDAVLDILDTLEFAP